MSKSHVLARKHLKQNSEYQKRHYDLKAVKRELQTGESHDGIPRVGSTLEEYVRETNGHCFSGHIIGCKGRMILPARGMAD
ncbi:Hypothetical predicted protein [Mytilus galloprovincialis]|uniref:Uncharacterized protein n=1 Tax=Mytilus galloprovincialis TaxID=29158 RepID=A0A8B6GGA6_MYTGA|nr:Hypothetical predicted protein [Mytilus galloprovincialis]